MARSSLTGSGSYMPIDAYLKKNEMTCVDYNPEELTNYMRQTIIDYREPPSRFEQDQQRYDTHSREKLHLRHTGDRSGGVMPWLPDGTFLDQVFLSDAGNSTLPDFQNLRNQIDLRVRDIPVYTDEDYSVPTKEVSASQLISNKDMLYNRAKKEMLIFDTSKDYIQIPGTNGHPLLGSHQLKKLINEQTPSFLSEEASSNRNWQVELSNNTPVGWQTTPDSMFKVSKYDTPRKMGDLTADQYNNKIGGVLDTDFLVSFEGKNIPRSVAQTIIEIMRQRKRVENFMRTSGTDFDKSHEQRTRKLKQIDASLKELMRRYSNHSSDMHSLNLEQTNMSGKKYISKPDIYKKEKSIVVLQLLDLIKKSTSNRKLGKLESDDLRNEIVQTATSDAIYNTASNKKLSTAVENNEMLWQSIAVHKKADHMTAFNYANVIHTQGINKDMFIVDDYKRLEGADIKNKRFTSTNNMYTPNALEYEPLKEVNAEIWNIGGMSNARSSLNMTTRDHVETELQENNSIHFTQPSRIQSSYID